MIQLRNPGIISLDHYDNYRIQRIKYTASADEIKQFGILVDDGTLYVPGLRRYRIRFEDEGDIWTVLISQVIHDLTSGEAELSLLVVAAVEETLRATCHRCMKQFPAHHPGQELCERCNPGIDPPKAPVAASPRELLEGAGYVVSLKYGGWTLWGPNGSGVVMGSGVSSLDEAWQQVLERGDVAMKLTYVLNKEAA